MIFTKYFHSATEEKEDAPKFNVRRAGEGSDINQKGKKENEEKSEAEEEESVSLPSRQDPFERNSKQLLFQ